MKANLYQTYNPARAHVYTVLLATPDSEWTVNDLDSRVPRSVDLSRNAIRSNMYLLLADRLVDLVDGQTVLTLKLTNQGTIKLQSVVEGWRRRGWRMPS